MMLLEIIMGPVLVVPNLLAASELPGLAPKDLNGTRSGLANVRLQISPQPQVSRPKEGVGSTQRQFAQQFRLLKEEWKDPTRTLELGYTRDSDSPL